jgi:hypothetical protein
VVLVIAVYALRQPSKKGEEAGSRTAGAGHTTSSSPHRSTSTRGSAPHSSAQGSSSGPSSAGKQPLVVLNNTTVPKLAERAKSTFLAGGWQVTSIGNLQNNILSTCAYYDPAVPGAQQAAQALMQQFPAIRRVAPKFAELPAGPIVVVLTPDYVSG